MSVEIYDRYVEIRDARGVSDYAVAKACGIGRSTFSDWRAGKSIPRIEKLTKIAAFLNVSLDYLVNGEEPAPAVEMDPQLKELFQLASKATPEQQAQAVRVFRALIGDNNG